MIRPKVPMSLAQHDTVETTTTISPRHHTTKTLQCMHTYRREKQRPKNTLAEVAWTGGIMRPFEETIARLQTSGRLDVCAADLPW